MVEKKENVVKSEKKVDVIKNETKINKNNLKKKNSTNTKKGKDSLSKNKENDLKNKSVVDKSKKITSVSESKRELKKKDNIRQNNKKMINGKDVEHGSFKNGQASLASSKNIYEENVKKKSGLTVLDVVLIILITAILTTLGTVFVLNRQYRKDNALYETELVSDSNITKFIKTYSEIDKNFYEEVDKEGMIDAALKGMMEYLKDNYSIYLNEDEKESLSDSLEGSYEGIGVVTQGNVIYKVYDNSAAAAAGLLIGDEIIKVNGEDITLENYQIISELLLSNGDKENEIVVKRNNEVLTYNLKAGKVYVPTVSSEVLEKKENKIGYIAISSFSSQTYKQFKSELGKIEEKGIESLIIDLRSNTGGYLNTAHNIASLFLEKGKIIYSLETKDKVTDYKDETDEKREYPIVVLVNSSTASASEILTAALKDSYGAVIVGKTTYGKGKVQSLMNYDKSMVKYTSAKWLRPNGDCIDEIGIEPDYEVSNEVKNNTIYDKQFDKAIQLLS